MTMLVLWVSHRGQKVPRPTTAEDDVFTQQFQYGQHRVNAILRPQFAVTGWVVRVAGQEAPIADNNVRTTIYAIGSGSKSSAW